MLKNTAMVILLLYSGSFLLFAQEAPKFLWATQAGDDGGHGSILVHDIAVDSDGNSFITGDFSGDATFGIPGNPDCIDLTAVEWPDTFIAKIDNDANFLWVNQADCLDGDYGYGIDIDGYGNSYIIGYFWESISFGPFELISRGGLDIFIVKIDPDGNYIWATQAGGGHHDYGEDIHVDSQGNIYISGNVRGNCYFGEPGAPGTIELITLGNYHKTGFIAKMDNDGNFLWVNQAGSYIDERALFSINGVDTDASGNTFITGEFPNTAFFGDPFSLPVITLVGQPTENYTDIFVAKLDAGGNFLWAKVAYSYGTKSNYSRGIAVDNEGNAVITGDFGKTIYFGESQDISLVSYGKRDIFIAKIDNTGRFLWARHAGGGDIDFGFGISVDSSDNVYITGEYTLTAYFGDPGHLNTTVLHPMPDSPFPDGSYVAKLDTNGNFYWAKRLGGYACTSYHIAVDNEGNAYIAGLFGGTVYFGEPDDPDTPQLYVPPHFDTTLFVACLDSGAWGADASVLPSDISFQPGMAEPGDTVEINARVYNYGMEDISQGNVEFYYSIEPDTGLNMIGTVSFYNLQTEDYADVSIQWETGNELDPRMYVITVFVSETMPNDINMINNIAYSELSLPVELAFFTARGYGGSADIRWMTVSEVNNLGFNLYRLKGDKVSPSASFVPVKLNEGIIPGQVNSSSPQLYTFRDKIKKGNYFYILECISTEGMVTDEYKTRLEWVF